MGRPLHRVPGHRRPRTPVTDTVELVGIDAIRGRGQCPARRRDPDPARAVRPARGPRLPEGREPPADRGVQDPRRLRGRRRADAGRARARRHHLLVGQPCPGRRARGSPARRAGRHRHARATLPPSSASASPPTAPRSSRSGRRPTSAASGPRRSPRNVGSRSSRRTTTTGSSPGRARSGSRSPRTCPTSRRSWCRSVVADSRAAWPRPSGPSRRGARVFGVEPELAADGRELLAEGEIVRWSAEDVVADDRRWHADAGPRRANVRAPARPPRRHRDGERGRDRGRRPPDRGTGPPRRRAERRPGPRGHRVPCARSSAWTASTARSSAWSAAGTSIPAQYRAYLETPLPG